MYFLQGYFCRALALELLGNNLIEVDAYNTHSKCVLDFIKSYELQNEKAILMAIKVAVDKGMK